MNIMQNLIGLGPMTEQVIASDCMLDANDAIETLAYALTKATTPTVRTTLQQQLLSTLSAQERIVNFMLGKGYINVINPQEQLRLDMKAADRVMNMNPGG